MTDEQAAELAHANEFNDLVPVGTPVRYWPGLRTGEGRASATRTPAWVLPSGTAVVSVEGYAGGIALTHVMPVPPASTPEEGTR